MNSVKSLLIISIGLIAAYLNHVKGQTVQDTVSMRHNLHFELFSPEKVYLHTDRDVYNAGDTIWFKGYLQNKSYNSDYPESNFIYVELTGFPRQTITKYGAQEAQHSVFFRAKIKREEDGFSGYIPTVVDWISNRYYVRAYTHWMLNESPEYIFKKEIGIINVTKDNLRERLDEQKAEALAYEKYELSVPQMKKVVERYDYDVQFLPESGNILSNYSNVLGVKAINNSGEGIKVTGKIYNSEKEILAKFTTNEIGMGSVSLPPLQSQEKIIAEVEDHLGNIKIIDLPEIQKSGGIINYQNNKGEILVTFCVSEDVNPAGLSIIFHNGSEVYLKKEINKSITQLKMEESSLTEGIHTATLISDTYQILAQRVFFVYGNAKIMTDITPVQERIKRREEVKLMAKVTDDLGSPIKGDFSVSITDMVVEKNKNTDNIVSYMLLTSELTGYIEDPRRYFEDTIPYEIRKREIDYLMLTQGWRYYDSDLIASGTYPLPSYGREYNQSLSGVVTGLMGEAQHSMISVISQDVNFSAIGELKGGGRFVLENIDFPEGTRFLVSAYNKRGRTRQYSPILDNEAYAPLTRLFHKPTVIEYSEEYKEQTEQYNSILGNDIAVELDQAVVVSSRITFRNNPTPLQSLTFRRDQVRTQEDMREYQDMDIFTYAANTFPGLMLAYSAVNYGSTQGPDDTIEAASPVPIEHTVSGRYLTTSKKNRVSSEMNIEYQSNFPISVYINRMPSTQDNLEPYLISDVETIVYLDDVMSDIFSQSRGTGGQFIGTGVLFVSLKKGVGAKHNIISSTPLGWQKKAHFYTPKYNKNETPFYATDLRYTVHWDPYIKSDENGVLEINFFASDRVNGYRIEIEGIKSDGSYYYYIGDIK